MLHGSGQGSASTASWATTAASTASRRGAEHRHEPVARGLDDLAAGAVDRGAQQLVVPAECGPHGVGRLLPQAGAALDVGEQDRDDTRRLRAR